VGHEQQRALPARAFQAGDEVEAGRIAAQQLAGNSVPAGDAPQIFGGARFVAGRIGGVAADELDQVLACPLSKGRGLPVDGSDGEQKEQCEAGGLHWENPSTRPVVR